MSNNTNTLFWVITGAVIVLTAFLILNVSQNNNLNKINNKFSDLFYNDNKIQNNEKEIDLSVYIPTGWKVMDIVMTNGVVYITGNPNNFYGGGCQFDTRIINTNDYDVHIINSKVKFYNSETNQLIIEYGLPFDRVLSKNDIIVSFTSIAQSICTINHRLEFIPWS